jgi:hypothetical protein
LTNSIFPVVCVVLGAALICAPADAAQQIWLSGVDPVVQADRGGRAESDFMDLFRPNAPWRGAAAAVQVFKLSTQFLQRSSDSDLAAVIQDLRRRHIALAMEAEILVATPRCGNGVPGYTTTAVIRKAAQRVAAQGGEIAYVAFDEPMTWGHFAHRACQYPTEDLVENIAPNIRALKAVFPAVRFGDIEPVTDQTSGRLGEILRFAELFKAKTGEPLSFLQADLIWQNNWRPQLTVWKSRLHAAGLAYGVVIDGDPADSSDLVWTRHAVQRYRELAADTTLSPDACSIQSWQPRPTPMWPEDDPGSLTGVVVQTVGR